MLQSSIFIPYFAPCYSSDLLSKCPYLKQEKGLTDEGLEVNF